MPPDRPFPLDLFPQERRALPPQPGATLLGGFAASEADQLLADIRRIEGTNPF